jgi:hypothetical protein
MTEVPELSDTERGIGGFGSTGKWWYLLTINGTLKTIHFGV